MPKDVVDISELEEVIMNALEEYKEDAEQAIANTLPLVGKETAQELQKISPKQSGDYAKGWKYQLDPRKKAKGHTVMVVYNKTHYRLTHLLEKGHAKVNGGRVDGIPHISKAADNAEEKAIKRIKEKLEAIR